MTGSLTVGSPSEPVPQPVRRWYDEALWARACAGQSWPLPPWARPLPTGGGEGLDGAGGDARPVWTEPCRAVDGRGPLDQVLGLLRTGRAAIEVRPWCGERGALALLVTDGRGAMSLVRRLRLVGAPAAAHPLPGVEVSGLPVERLVDEVMRLAPVTALSTKNPTASASAPAPDPAPDPVTLPLEAAVALVGALRDGPPERVAVLCRHAGVDRVPPLLDALSDPWRATLEIRMRSAGRPGCAWSFWVQTGGGAWVQLRVDRRGTLRHKQVARQDIAHSVLVELTDALWGAVGPADSKDGGQARTASGGRPLMGSR